LTASGDLVLFDHLVLDPSLMDFPPESIWQSVQEPGYGIILDELVGDAQQVRFLDESGNIAHIVDT
jgi:hypothetical protein